MLWLVQGSVFILATLLVEAGAWRRLVCWWRRGQREADTGDTEDKDLDEDVVKERLRVLSGKDADVLQVKNLFKRQVFIVAKKRPHLLKDFLWRTRYRKNAKQAVDRLTFGVQRAECFGLLGEQTNTMAGFSV